MIDQIALQPTPGSVRVPPQIPAKLMRRMASLLMVSLCFCGCNAMRMVRVELPTQSQATNGIIVQIASPIALEEAFRRMEVICNRYGLEDYQPRGSSRYFTDHSHPGSFDVSAGLDDHRPRLWIGFWEQGGLTVGSREFRTLYAEIFAALTEQFGSNTVKKATWAWR